MATRARPGPPQRPSPESTAALPLDVQEYFYQLEIYQSDAENRISSLEDTASKSIKNLLPGDAELPTTNPAAAGTVNDHPTLDFDDTTTEGVWFTLVTPNHYAGQEIAVTVFFAMASATTGSVFWRGTVENMTGNDITTDNLASNSGAQFGTVPSTAGVLTSVAFTFPVANGGNDWLNGLTANNMFRIFLIRDADEANDTATGDARLVAVQVRWL